MAKKRPVAPVDILTRQEVAQEAIERVTQPGAAMPTVAESFSTLPMRQKRPNGVPARPEDKVAEKALFVQYYAQVGNKLVAATAAGTTTESIRQWLKRDPEFADAVDRAWDDYKDRVRAEIHRRAFDGNPLLLIFHAKAIMPEYRDKHELSGPGGGPIEISDARERLITAVERIFANAGEAETPHA